MKHRFWIATLGICLVGCSAPAEPEPEQQQPPSDIRKQQPLLDWFSDAEEETAVSELRQSYESAVTVRDIMLTLIEDLDAEARNTLAPVLQSFSDDLDALKFYVELAERQPLSEAENQIVADLTADIDEAMLLFGRVAELLL